jgi:hypothetical protein
MPYYFKGNNWIIVVDKNVIPLCLYWSKRDCEIEELIGLDYSTISVGRKRLKIECS